jgi:ribonuclease D
MKIKETFIETQKQLQDFCEKIKSSNKFAIDTEFVRVNTYFPIPCIFQVADQNNCGAIDLTKGLDLSQLEKILSNKKAVLVIHAFRQDLEILEQMFENTNLNFFDTQIAEMFLGTDEPPSYGKLVEKYFNIKLKKAAQYSNWQKRPLSEAQLEYCFLDVKYLLEIYKRQQTELKKESKLEFFVEEIQGQLDNFLSTQDDIDISSFYNFIDSAEKLIIAEFICGKRLKKAITKNIPKAKVLANKQIIELLQSLPKTGDLTDQMLSDIEKEEGIVMSDEIVKRYQKIKKISELYRNMDKNIVKKLQRYLDDKSKEYKISKQLIAAKSDLQKFIIDPKNNRLIKGWRSKVFGKFISDKIS